MNLNEGLPPEGMEEEEPGAIELPTHLVVPPEAAGMRLDTWLARRPGSPSRSRVQQLVKDGLVLVNGEEAKRSYEVQGGETVNITWPGVEDSWPFPQDIPLDIVYDDADTIVVNKQKGLITHPSAGHPDGTLVNALLFRYPDLPGINGVKRPGIVHRLDKDTTGLMVVAKSDRAMTSLAKQLQNKTMQRRYLALIIGDPSWESITVNAAVGRDDSNRLRRAIDGPFSRDAVSHFSVLLRSHQFTLIRCQLETGRTHQIRIHCKHIGHPIVCDEAYDGHVNRCVERLLPTQHELKRLLVHYERPFLHSNTMKFYHPGLQKEVRFAAPPPQDSMELLRHIFGPKVDEVCGQREISV